MTACAWLTTMDQCSRNFTVVLEVKFSEMVIVSMEVVNFHPVEFLLVVALLAVSNVQKEDSSPMILTADLTSIAIVYYVNVILHVQMELFSIEQFSVVFEVHADNNFFFE